MIGTIRVVLKDAYGKQYQQEWVSKDLLDFPTLTASATALLTNLGNLVAARILRYDLRITTTYTDTVDAGANKDEALLIQYEKENSFRDTQRIMAPVSSIFDANGQVDTTNALLTAWAANFAVLGDWTFSDGESQVSIEKAYLEEHG